MRLPALLLTLFATSALFAADEPKATETPKGDTPAAKPAEKAAPKKTKKTMGIPEIPEGVSISDGVKLQAAWVKTQDAPAPQASEDDKKKKGNPRAAADEALAKAMIKADPSLNPELVRTYLEASRQKAGNRTKKKAK
jgi:hypothetical protein